MLIKKHITGFVGPALLMLLFATTGCSIKIIEPVSPADQQIPTQQQEVEETKERIKLRARASLELTHQGQMFLKNGRPDDAISILEKSINLNPNNGQNYYYMAEAWLLKGNSEQAMEFNRLAAIYLNDDADWLIRVIEQHRRIEWH